MDAFTIKDLENLSGIKAHTIRIWEQRYNFLKPRRSFTNIRYYSNHELKIVLNISLLNKHGIKISHIDKMNEEEIHEKILSLSDANAPQERLVNELLKEMIELNLVKFESIIDNFMLARGIERSINQLIFPFLDKIGFLWLTNHINPAQEHLVSNIIRQKLIVGIEGVRVALKPGKSILLFLPEGEHHEMGLLFVHYLLKLKGAEVFYLGSNVPLKDLEYIVRLKKPVYIFSHLTSIGPNFNFDKFLGIMQKKFSESKIILSGQLTQRYEKKVMAPVFLKKTLSEVMDFIDKI